MTEFQTLIGRRTLKGQISSKLVLKTKHWAHVNHVLLSLNIQTVWEILILVVTKEAKIIGKTFQPDPTVGLCYSVEGLSWLQTHQIFGILKECFKEKIVKITRKLESNWDIRGAVLPLPLVQEQQRKLSKKYSEAPQKTKTLLGTLKIHYSGSTTEVPYKESSTLQSILHLFSCLHYFDLSEMIVKDVAGHNLQLTILVTQLAVKDVFIEEQELKPTLAEPRTQNTSISHSERFQKTLITSPVSPLDQDVPSERIKLLQEQQMLLLKKHEEKTRMRSITVERIRKTSCGSVTETIN
eukprot:TRINITY_DN13011_c0_g1_i1.p1 TRINITY_DN13011_c0_g1~~TRINITY_DN13011_c0_g1_i1.p1  ORF type:complete len:306 (-),score=55.35 TRINITY_DN13011_c0_g1_i1:124-1011(-)